MGLILLSFYAISPEDCINEDTHNTFQAVFGRHSQPKQRTNLTHPFEIATLPAGDDLGTIGVTFSPGKVQGRREFRHGSLLRYRQRDRDRPHPLRIDRRRSRWPD